MRLRKGSLILACAVLGSGGFLAWRFGFNPTIAKSSPAAPIERAIPVTAGVAKARDVPVYLRGLGTVQAAKTVTVKSRVNGQITKVFFTEGQDVKAGAPLFQIDPRPYQAALEQAQATKEKDTAALQVAQLDLERDTRLLPSGSLTRQAYDQQRAQVQQLQASIKMDQAQIDTAQLNLDFSLIRSPIEGRTGERLVDLGNLVQGETGAGLVVITQIEPIYVSFSLPATNIDRIRQNQAKAPLKVLAYAMDDKTLLSQGELTLIDNRIDTTTGTIHLKAKFVNTDKRLWPGEFVNARLVLAIRKNAVTVPAETIMQGPNGPYVYVIGAADKVKRRDVQIAATQDGLAVVAKGLSSGDRVVVAGQYRLRDGATVRARTQEPASGEQAAR